MKSKRMCLRKDQFLFLPLSKWKRKKTGFTILAIYWVAIESFIWILSLKKRKILKKRRNKSKQLIHSKQDLSQSLLIRVAKVTTQLGF